MATAERTNPENPAGDRVKNARTYTIAQSPALRTTR